MDESTIYPDLCVIFTWNHDSHSWIFACQQMNGYFQFIFIFPLSFRFSFSFFFVPLAFAFPPAKYKKSENNKPFTKIKNIAWPPREIESVIYPFAFKQESVLRLRGERTNRKEHESRI